MLPQSIKSQREIDMMFREYSRAVRSCAYSTLQAHGFVGLDVRHDAPDNLEALLKFFYSARRPNKFPVYDGGCENTLFEHRMDNYLQRAWHDIGHVVLNAEFNMQGEIKVAEWQCRQLESGLHKRIVKVDIVDQTRYFERTGAYPVNQKEFVTELVFNGGTVDGYIRKQVQKLGNDVY